MSLKNISGDILSKAQAQEEAYTKELEEKMSQLEKEYDERISSFKSKLKEKNDSEIRLATEKIKGKARIESKKITLDAKSQVVTQSRENALERLKNLEDKEREKLLLNLIRVAKSKLKYETVYCSKTDFAFLKGKIKDSKIIVSDIDGLIFESKTGEEILNLTFDTILSDIFERNEDRISEMLFR